MPADNPVHALPDHVEVPSNPEVPGRTVDGVASRRLAIEAARRIDAGSAYANIVLPSMLERSTLSPEDRRFVSNLVYGSTRMRRACDYLIDRFTIGETDDQIRAALRIGTYQLAYLGTPPHAAVAATVEAVEGKGRSMVNAVLRRVAEADNKTFPDEATELSYPDWIVSVLSDVFGREQAVNSMRAMNEAARVSTRDDGYVQDPASQKVVKSIGALAGEVVVDLCAAPGGKATGIAAAGAFVAAGDRRMSRVNLIAQNIERLDSSTVAFVADGRQPPLRPESADHVLVDAPCTGLGSLRRRPDARWRVQSEDAPRLAELQRELVVAGLGLLKPSGILTYSVCTFGDAEGADVMESIVEAGLATYDRLPAEPWTKRGPMAILPPGEDDGMMLCRLRRSELT